MFSLDKFYNILHNNLITQFVNGRSITFYPFGTYQNKTFLSDKFSISNPPFGPEKHWRSEQQFFHCYFFDQEPYYDTILDTIQDSLLHPKNVSRPGRANVLANSEYSDIKQLCCSQFNMHDWYYFFHGFAALDWYRDFQYIRWDSIDMFDKVFICYNHLSSKYRSHRLHLVSNLIQQDLVKHGLVSLFLKDDLGTWRNTIQDPQTPLDNRARVKIYKALKDITEPLVIDTREPNGLMSANIDINQLTRALWHIVTETVYFLPKLHLTEKIFKPIVAKRPFILVAAPGNLAYLKRYGFKTFDHWIDESYDNEQDHYIRIEKITAEIAKLCALEPIVLKQMHIEMQEILEYNFQHFYGDFKKIIVNELVDNFGNLCIPTKLPLTYLQEVKNRLLQ